MSVCVISYNQEKYIRECLQSILDQKTNFDFELIIGDDYSTDSTPKIIQEFVDKYPGRIVSILNKTKIGGTRNYIETHKNATGQYVAHVDGDDIVFPGKLQFQADFLDKRLDLSLVWHVMQVFDDDGRHLAKTHPHLNDVMDTNNICLSDLLLFGSLGAASSIMYRRAYADYLTEITGDALDFYFSAMLLEQGNGARINSVFGGYRVNSGLLTLSGWKTQYLKASPMRKLYAEHLSKLYEAHPNLKREIFLNSIFHLCIELRFFRPTSIDFLSLCCKTFSIRAIRSVPRYFSSALRLRRKY